ELGLQGRPSISQTPLEVRHSIVDVVDLGGCGVVSAFENAGYPDEILEIVVELIAHSKFTQGNVDRVATGLEGVLGRERNAGNQRSVLATLANGSCRCELSRAAGGGEGSRKRGSAVPVIRGSHGVGAVLADTGRSAGYAEQATSTSDEHCRRSEALQH